MIFVKITREQIALGANLRSDIIIYSVIDSYGGFFLTVSPPNASYFLYCV